MASLTFPTPSHAGLQADHCQLQSASSGPVTRAMRASYHPKGYGVSEGLKRARRPFRTRNAITGLVIMGFAASVYIYSIRAVKQDDFSDVLLPSELERAGMTSIEDEKREKERIKAEVRQEFSLGQANGLGVDLPATTAPPPRSVWADLRARFAGPIVPNAPPVDRIGRVSDRPNEMPTRRIV